MANFDGPRDGSIDHMVDVGSLSLAATFGPVAFPKGMPEHLKQSILDKAEQARTADGSIGGNQMAHDDRRRQAEREEAEEDLSTWTSMAQRQHEEREREEWARTKSSVAGATMTGADWAQLAERLRSDSKFKDEIMAAFRERGMSETEAEQRYARVVEVADAAKIPPSQRTERQAEVIEKAEVDSEFSTDLKVVQAMSRNSPASEPASVAAAPKPVAPTLTGGLDI